MQVLRMCTKIRDVIPFHLTSVRRDLVKKGNAMSEHDEKVFILGLEE